MDACRRSHTPAVRLRDDSRGLGAPLFLFLAGVAVVLSAESKFRKTGDFAGSWRAVAEAGMAGLRPRVPVPPAVVHPERRIQRAEPAEGRHPEHHGAGDRNGRRYRAARTRAKPSVALLFAAAAVAICLLTPIVRATPLLAWLPDPVEWYFRPSPGRTNFTLFPWAGFVFAGAAVGVVMDALRPARRMQLTLVCRRCLLVWLAYEASFRPPLHARSEYWTTSASFFFLRVGLLTLLLPLGYSLGACAACGIR